MNATRIAAVLTALVLSTAASTFAQSGRQVQRRADPFDIIAQTLSLSSHSGVSNPSMGTVSAPRPADQRSYEEYLAAYNLYRADYARYQQQYVRQNSTPGWVKAMQGISGGLQVADQAVGVYQNILVAESLKQSLGQ